MSAARKTRTSRKGRDSSGKRAHVKPAAQRAPFNDEGDMEITETHRVVRDSICGEGDDTSGPIAQCPYLGAGSVARAIVAAFARELDDQGSSYGPELVGDIGACEGRDFAAGWHLERMTPERAASATARAIAYLAGAARLDAEALRFLAEAPTLSDAVALEKRADRPRADGTVLTASRSPRDLFTMYAAHALNEVPGAGDLDQCVRDVFRQYVRVAAIDGLSLGALDVALDIIRSETAQAGTPRDL